MLESWRSRALSESRRFKRSLMHEPAQPSQRLQTQILKMIDQRSIRLLLLLHAMTKGGMAALKKMANPEFEQLFGFVHGIYRIGPVEEIDGETNENGIGLAVLPAARVLGKEFPLAVIMIPVQVIKNGREDVFILAICRRGKKFELDVSVAWRDDQRRNDWPDDPDTLRLLRDNVDEVIRIVSALRPSEAMLAA